MGFDVDIPCTRRYDRVIVSWNTLLSVRHPTEGKKFNCIPVCCTTKLN